MSDKDIKTIIGEMRQVSEIIIRAAGEGEQINLAALTGVIDGWRFSLEKMEQAYDEAIEDMLEKGEE